jgi:hypothetical protein
VINDCGIGEIGDLEADAVNQAFGYVIGDFARRKSQQEYAKDMTRWAWDKLRVRFHEKQDEVGKSLVVNRNTAVAAGHGTGKSFQAAIAACWWVDTHPINQVYVATTAPTHDQISEIIFREVKRIHAISAELAEKGIIPASEQLQGRITEENTWKIERGGRLYTVMKGRKPPDNKAADAFQGLHARYVLAIGDEATGLSEEMIDGLANITSNDTSRRLLISNPTNPFSYLGKIFLKPTFDETGKPTWNKIHVSVFNLPTFHGGGRCSCPEHEGMPYGLGFSREAMESMSGPQFVKDKKAEYGEDSARYKARVLGEFAFEAGSTLFSEYDIATAVDAVVEISYDDRPILGVDVARFGEDWSYVYRADAGLVMRRKWVEDPDDEDDGKELPREPALDDNGLNIVGYKLRYVDSWRDAPAVTRRVQQKDGTWLEMEGTAEKVHSWAMAINAKEVRVDASGLGGGVIDGLFRLAQEANADYRIIEMLGGAASPDRRTHYNNRAYQFDHFRKLAFQGKLDIDPTDEQLIDEMAGIIYDFADGQSGGGLKIESKESMRRRGVKSPDAADAAWYALADLDHLTENLPGDLVSTDFDEVLAGSSDWRTRSGFWNQTW